MHVNKVISIIPFYRFQLSSPVISRTATCPWSHLSVWRPDRSDQVKVEREQMTERVRVPPAGGGMEGGRATTTTGENVRHHHQYYKQYFKHNLQQDFCILK